MDMFEAGVTMVRLGVPLLPRPGGWALGVCILGLTVAVDAASDGAGRAGAGSSA